MDIMEKIRQQVPAEHYRELEEYIVQVKDEAYWDGIHAANEDQGGV